MVRLTVGVCVVIRLFCNLWNSRNSLDKSPNALAYKRRLKNRVVRPGNIFNTTVVCVQREVSTGEKAFKVLEFEDDCVALLSFRIILFRCCNKPLKQSTQNPHIYWRLCKTTRPSGRKQRRQSIRRSLAEDNSASIRCRTPRTFEVFRTPSSKTSSKLTERPTESVCTVE